MRATVPFRHVAPTQALLGSLPILVMLAAVGGCARPYPEFRGLEMRELTYLPSNQSLTMKFAIKGRLYNPLPVAVPILLSSNATFKLEGFPETSAAIELPPPAPPLSLPTIPPNNGHGDFAAVCTINTSGLPQNVFGKEFDYALRVRIFFVDPSLEVVRFSYNGTLRVPRPPDMAFTALAMAPIGSAPVPAPSNPLAALPDPCLVLFPTNAAARADCQNFLGFLSNPAAKIFNVAGCNGFSVTTRLKLTNRNEFPIRVPYGSLALSAGGNPFMSLMPKRNGADLTGAELLAGNGGSIEIDYVAELHAPDLQAVLPGGSRTADVQLQIDLGYGAMTSKATIPIP